MKEIKLIKERKKNTQPKQRIPLESCCTRYILKYLSFSKYSKAIHTINSPGNKFMCIINLQTFPNHVTFRNILEQLNGNVATIYTRLVLSIVNL